MFDFGAQDYKHSSITGGVSSNMNPAPELFFESFFVFKTQSVNLNRRILPIVSCSMSTQIFDVI